MKVALQRADRDLRVAEAAERGIDRGPARRVEGAVADQHRVRPGPLGLGPQQVVDHPSAALLLSLEDEADVEGRLAVRVHHGLVGLQETEDLSLVVRRAAGVELAVADGGRERRRVPFLDRIGRLDVVVAVDQERRAAGDDGPLGPDHRMPVALDQVHHRAAQPGQLGAEPVGGAAGVLGMCGEGAHAGNGEEVGELLQQPGLLAIDEGRVHGGSL